MSICIKEKVDAEKPERSHALMFFVSVLERFIVIIIIIFFFFFFFFFFLWLTLYFVYFKRTLETHGPVKIFELINNEFSSLVILIWETSLFLNVSLSNFFKADLP